jgi:hypothetical protein
MFVVHSLKGGNDDLSQILQSRDKSSFRNHPPLGTVVPFTVVPFTVVPFPAPGQFLFKTSPH